MAFIEPQPGELVTHIGFTEQYGPVLLELVVWSSLQAKVRVVTCFKPVPEHVEIGEEFNVHPGALRRPNPLELLALAAL